MIVSIVYHTRFGNNAAIAHRLSDHLENMGHGVSVHPISEARSSEIPSADLYLVGSPTQIGTLPMRMSRFLGRMKVPSRSRFGVFATFAEPDSAAPLRMAAAMEEQGASAAAPALLISVKGLKGPMEAGWEQRVDDWADQVVEALGNTE